MCHRIEIRAAPVRISIGLHDVNDDHVNATISFESPEVSFTTGRIFYGMDIESFVDGLARLHRELSGTTRLYDWDGDPLLCFTIIDDVRHDIAVGGRLWLAQYENNARSEDDFAEPSTFSGSEMVLTFEGPFLDQSYLPEIIGQARRFLNESRISTASPMDSP